MFRSILVQNRAFLRASLLNKVDKKNIVRVLSISGFKKCNNLSRSKVTDKIAPTSVWSTNFCRAYSDLPPHIKVNLPALSPTMDQGTIVSWEKKEGDKLNEGDLLAEIETDKATMGFETPEEGYLAKILVPAGSKGVPVGQLVCIIVENQEDVAKFKDFKDDSPATPKKASSPPPAARAASPPPPPPPPVPSAPAAAPAHLTAAPTHLTAAEQKGRVFASPMAKRLAEVQQLRLEGRGSGIFGSIKSTDLAGLSPAASAVAGKAAGAAAAAPIPPPGGYIDIPVSNMRSVIAKRLLQSKQTIPHFYLTMECQVDKLLKLREKVNKKLEKEKVKVSLNDFIIKAVAVASRKVPETNSSWMDTVIRRFDNVDVSVAVSTDTGLITPIIFNADRKGVVEISKNMKELATKARENKLKPHEFQGGTISVSSLGMFGTTQFCAIINPPQSCILAVGTTNKKLVVDKDTLKGFKEVTVMNVTLCCDHRTVDGAVGAKWLQYFRDYVEDPQNMIL